MLILRRSHMSSRWISRQLLRCSLIFVLTAAGIELAFGDYSQSLDNEIHVSPRSAGMAGVGLGFIDDWNAAFLNPAKIGGGRNTHSPGLRSISFPSLSVESTRYSMAFAQDLASSSSLGGEIAPVLEGLDGKRGIHFREQFFPNFVYGRVMFGLLQSAVLNAQSYRLRAPQTSVFSDSGSTFDQAADVYFRSDAAVVTGFSVPMGKQADFGLAARYGLRTVGKGSAELGADTEEASGKEITDSINGYQGFAVDAGIFYLIHEDTGLGLSVVGRNIGEGNYSAQDEGPDVSDIRYPMDLDVGLSLNPQSRRAPFTPAFGVELHDTLRKDIPFSDKVRIGGELAFGPSYKASWLALRVGHDLHAASYGASIDLFLFRFEVAIYNSIVDLPNGESRNDSRFLLRTSWDLQQ